MKSWNEMREVITAFSKRWDNTNNVWGGQIGPSTNSLTITRTQLTGLSNSCRRHTVTITGTTDILSVGNGGTGTTGVSPVENGATTDSLTTYDPSTGIETETVSPKLLPNYTNQKSI